MRSSMMLLIIFLTSLPASMAYAQETGLASQAESEDAQGSSSDAGEPDGKEKKPKLVPKAAKIVEVSIALASAPEDELADLKELLQRFKGDDMSPEIAAFAERALLGLKRYRTGKCEGVPLTVGKVRLSCTLTRARWIDEVVIQGLPPQLLESELRRRIFIRRGESLQAAHDEEGRVEKQRRRILDFLHRQGLYGVEVKVLAQRLNTSGATRLLVTLEGGTFVKVRKVTVKNALPLKSEYVHKKFAKMCAQQNTWLAAFETGHFACYTTTLLRETSEGIEAELRKRGFAEARVSVESLFVKSSDDKKCRPKSDTEPRCVDLVVDLQPGRLLNATFSIHDEQGNVHQTPRFSNFYDRFKFAYRMRDDASDLVTRGFQVATQSRPALATDTLLDLREFENALTFKSSAAIDQAEAEYSRSALKEAIAAHGYFNARVEMTYTDRGKDVVDVHYAVWPGPIHTIRRIKFVGNSALSDDELLEKVKLASVPRRTGTPGFPIPSLLQGDAERLEQFLLGRGFADATVNAGLVKSGDHTVDVVFRIHEGTGYRIAGIKLEGGDPKLAPFILKQLEHCSGVKKPKEGDDCANHPLLPNLLDELDRAGVENQRVVSAYTGLGYPYVHARVELSPQWTDVGPYILVKVWQEKPGEIVEVPTRVRVSKIFINGNASTDRSPILKDMGLVDVEGTLLDPKKVNAGISRLRRTGLFSRIRHTYLPTKEGDDLVDILIELEERPSHSIDVSASFSTDNLFALRLEDRDKNLLGSMLDWSAYLDMGLFIGRLSEAGLGVRWPRIQGTNVDAKFNTFARYSDNPTTGLFDEPPSNGFIIGRWQGAANEVRDRIFSSGATVGTEWRMLPSIFRDLRSGVDYELTWTWFDSRVERVDPWSSEALRTVDGLTKAFSAPDTRTGQISPFIRYSNIKNPFDPVSGWHLDLGLHIAHPWLAARESMFLFTGTTAFYIPITKRFTFATQLRGWGGTTTLEPLAQTSVLLVPEFIALGGDRSVRGFNRSNSSETFGLTGLADGVNSGDIRSFSYVGGIANIELRATLLENFLIGDVKLAGFIDAGFVTDEPAALTSLNSFVTTVQEKDQFGISAGVGVRYVLPVGPLSFDFALPLNETNDTGTFPFVTHIQFGYAF